MGLFAPQQETPPGYPEGSLFSSKSQSEIELSLCSAALPHSLSLSRALSGGTLTFFFFAGHACLLVGYEEQISAMEAATHMDMADTKT